MATSGGWGGTWGGGPWGGSGGIPGTEYESHVISSTELRLKFEARIADDGNPTNPLNYVLDSPEPPGTFFLPPVESARFEDSGNRVIIVTFSQPLTLGKFYDVRTLAMTTAIGSFPVSSLPHLFFATVPDPPRALFALQSALDSVDIVFDRSVGPTSPVATSDIRPLGGGAAVPLTLIAHAPPIPDNHLRFILNAGMAVADAYELVWASVIGEDLNVGSGVIPLTLPLRAPTPFDISSLTQAQLIDADVDLVVNEALNSGTFIKAYFNLPMDPASVVNTANWSIFMPGSHTIPDASSILVLDPLVAPIIDVANEVKANFNAHLTRFGVHLSEPLVNLTSLLVLTDDLRTQYEAHRIETDVHGKTSDIVTLASELDTDYAAHIVDGTFHTAPDGTNTTATTPVDLATTITFLNEMRTAFNAHRIFAAAHPTLDTISIVAAAAATDYSSAVILGNELKQKFNEHRDLVIPPNHVHEIDDLTNVVTASNAAISDLVNIVSQAPVTDLASAILILNEIKVDFNAHRTEISVHDANDNSNVVASADATEIVSAAILANEIELRYENHRTRSGVHLIDDTFNVVTATNPGNLVLSPDATNDQSSIDIINEAQQKYVNHLVEPGVHRWDDTPNNITVTAIADGDVAGARTALDTDYYPAFNGHITDEYAVTVTSARFLSFVPDDPFVQVAEVQIEQFDARTPFRIEATIDDAAASTTTNPADFSGSIDVESLQAEPVFQVIRPPNKSSILLRFDKGVFIQNVKSVSVKDPNGFPVPITSVQRRSSIPAMMFCLDNIIDDYNDYHIVLSLGPHEDVFNVIGLRPSNTLQSIIDSANLTKSTLNDHFLTVKPPAVALIHSIEDNDNFILAPNATDQASVERLIEEIRGKYLSHQRSRKVHLVPPAPLSSFERVFGIKLFDSIEINMEDLRNDESYAVELIVDSTARDNGEDVTTTHRIEFGTTFTGIVQPPAVASAISEIGLKPTDEGIIYKPDHVEAFLSKPMRQEPVTISDISITGGVILKDFVWKGDRRIIISVVNLQSISYDITVSNLTDKAGNAIL